MVEIRRVVRTASRRLFLTDLAHTLTVTTSIAAGGLIATLVAQRVLGWTLTTNHWLTIAGSALGTAVVGALVWSIVRKPTELAAARAIDDAAGLKESLSTALVVEKSDAPWDRAVVESARAAAVAVDVRRALPFRAPESWYVPGTMAIGLGALWFTLPTFDVLGRLAARDQQAQAQQQVVLAKQEVEANAAKIEELIKKAGLDLATKEAGSPGEKAGEQLTADEIRRAAIARLTNLQDQLEKLRDGEQAQTLKAVQDQMRQLKTPGPGPLENMSRALQRGDFSQAKAELEKLQQQLESGQLAEDDKAKLQEQLKKLAEQLNKAAENRKELEQKLREAGLSPEEAKRAARDPEELKKEMEKRGMSEQQKKDLEQQQKASDQACKACQNAGNAMSQAAQGMSQSGMNSEGQQGMEKLSEQLSELEQMSQEASAMQALENEAKAAKERMGGQCSNPGDGMGEGQSSAGNNPWRAGETQGGGEGQGSGGPGSQGMGRGPESSDAPAQATAEMSRSKNTGGPTIGSRLVYGEQVRGESVAEFSEAVASGTSSASKAIDAMQVPREYHSAVKHYFGRLEARAKPQPPEQRPAEPKK